jgi:hypothetical protein
MTKTLLSGRLVCDGDGHLYIHPVDDDGEVLVNLHLADEDGQGTNELIPELVEVRWDEEAGGYVEVTDGKSHNEVHHRNEIKTISGTSGPLYDAQGKLVYEGDPHHDYPLSDDPHFDESSPNHTKVETIPDEISAVATSHTEAYTS